MGKDEEKSNDDTVLTNPPIKPVLSNTELINNNIKTNEQQKDEKKNVDELRKVIKINEKDTDQRNLKADQNQESFDRENLEQKRAILQSIKDFDFQIKKNQEEITSINKKLDTVTKDLDDLVSLYEIVSEQMNPFVGLSKVTKKRIDALENFTKEIDDLKNRLGDLESFAERAGVNLNEIRLQKDIDHQEGKIENEINISTIPNNVSEKYSNEDLDQIVERSFNDLTFEQDIDLTIEEFLESLKDKI